MSVLDTLDLRLYSGQIDMTDVETWRNRDEKTIASKITSSNLTGEYCRATLFKGKGDANDFSFFFPQFS